MKKLFLFLLLIPAISYSQSEQMQDPFRHRVTAEQVRFCKDHLQVISTFQNPAAAHASVEEFKKRNEGNPNAVTEDWYIGLVHAMIDLYADNKVQAAADLCMEEARKHDMTEEES